MTQKAKDSRLGKELPPEIWYVVLFDVRVAHERHLWSQGKV